MNQQILAEKKSTVAGINETLKENHAAIVVSYSGLSVAEVNGLRSALKKDGAKLAVYKNTLVKKAVEQEGLTELEPLLKGPNALVIAKEAGAGLQALKDFAEGHKAFEIKGGLLDGTFCDADKLNALANVGNRENAIATFLSTLQSPLVMFALTLKALGESKGA